MTNNLYDIIICCKPNFIKSINKNKIFENESPKTK